MGYSTWICNLSTNGVSSVPIMPKYKQLKPTHIRTTSPKRSLKKYDNTIPLWVGESGPHNHGGIENVTDRFICKYSPNNYAVNLSYLLTHRNSHMLYASQLLYGTPMHWAHLHQSESASLDDKLWYVLCKQ